MNITYVLFNPINNIYDGLLERFVYISKLCFKFDDFVLLILFYFNLSSLESLILFVLMLCDWSLQLVA